MATTQLNLSNNQLSASSSQPMTESQSIPAKITGRNAMERFFFHIMNGKAILDDIGIELDNMDQVRAEAIRASGQMLSSGLQRWNGQAWQMIVTNANDTIVFGVNCSVDRHGL